LTAAIRKTETAGKAGATAKTPFAHTDGVGRVGVAEGSLLCVFFLGAILRIVGVWMPVNQQSWRESDVAAIARNYYREGMNPFYPRIDWRGDGPGYAEMEFPVLPWLMAVSYKLFGYNEVVGRLLSYVLSLLALYGFIRAAQHLLPEVPAIAASIFFALSPLVIGISKSLQPEGLMFACYIWAVYAFIRWLDDDSWKYFTLAIGATALSILAKATAAHLGFLFAVLLLRRNGFSSLRDYRTWVFAGFSLLPALAWYMHAHRFFVVFGNSLGVSNEYHWVGWDFFTNPAFITGIARSELFYVWTPVGVAVAAIGLLYRPDKEGTVLSLAWLCSVFCFFILAARTTSSAWAAYYHVVSVPAVALLFGIGVASIQRLLPGRGLVRFILVSGVAAGALALVAGNLGITASSVTRVATSGRRVVMALLAAAVLSTAIAVFKKLRSAKNLVSWVRMQTIREGVGYAALICIPVAFLFLGRATSYGERPSKLFVCAKSFAPLLSDNGLILASGGLSKDPTGHSLAFNISYMFYWLDRKGFNICVEDQTLDEVRSFSQRGAHYFVAEKRELNRRPGFEAELRGQYPVLADCGDALLFRISPANP